MLKYNLQTIAFLCDNYNLKINAVYANSKKNLITVIVTDWGALQELTADYVSRDTVELSYQFQFENSANILFKQRRKLK